MNNVTNSSKDAGHKEQVMHSAVSMQKTTYSGPLPAPADFKAYDTILKGAAERILSMAEKNTEHRIKMEESIIRNDYKTITLGQILGFILALLFLCASVWLAVNGHEVVASVIGGTTIVSIVCAFVVGRITTKS